MSFRGILPKHSPEVVLLHMLIIKEATFSKKKKKKRTALSNI